MWPESFFCCGYQAGELILQDHGQGRDTGRI